MQQRSSRVLSSLVVILVGALLSACTAPVVETPPERTEEPADPKAAPPPEPTPSGEADPSASSLVVAEEIRPENCTGCHMAH